MKFVLLCLISMGASAGGFAPENDFYIPESFEGAMATGVSKSQFNAVIDRTEKIYRPIMKKLRVDRQWSDGTVNASAHREGSTQVVTMYGGLARFPGMTADAFALVLCHEIGHHIGGAPRYDNGGDWASVEGQSDYYSTNDCAKRVFADPKKQSDVGGLALAKALERMAGGDPSKISVNTPDQSKVSRTYESHPEAQCRLDTYIAGTLGRARPRCWYAGH